MKYPRTNLLTLTALAIQELVEQKMNQSQQATDGHIRVNYADQDDMQETMTFTITTDQE